MHRAEISTWIQSSSSGFNRCQKPLSFLVIVFLTVEVPLLSFHRFGSTLLAVVPWDRAARAHP